MSRFAFTLVEIIVAIGIIAILLGLAVPALMGARTIGGQAVSLANARTTASDILAYTQQANQYPFVTLGQNAPGVPDSVGSPDIFMIPWWPEGSAAGTNTIWWLDSWWPGLVSSVAPWEEHYESWVSPGSHKKLTDSSITVSYHYSNSFQARPELWSTPAWNGDNWRDVVKPVRPHEVVFPSLKALVWDAELAYINPPPARINGHLDAKTPIAFPDGHAAIHHPSDAIPGVPNPLNGLPNNDMRLHNTPDGVKGRDY